MNRFDGKIALLTGAASGVGKATAIRLASEGAKVFGLDINAEGMEDTKATVGAAGGEMTCRVTDIGSVEECHAAAAACVETYGGIDVLGNIAGIANQRHVHQVTEAEWDLMNNVNLKGMFFLTQAALPHILEREGNIVNIASNAASMGQAYLAPYCATKGAVAQLTRALAMEYVKQPIRINAIAPGGTDTAMNANYELAADTDFDLLQAAMGHRGFGQPEDIAALFAFLASDDAGNIHGSIINSDNGLTAS